MLSPDITNTKDLLANSFFEMNKVLGYSHTVNNLVIGFLVPDPDWLPSVRSRIKLLSKAGSEMTLEYPDIWSPILVSFLNYIPIINVITELQKKKDVPKEKWIIALKSLETELISCISSTNSSIDKMETRSDAFKNIQPLLAKSIEDGWKALSDEEHEMLELVEQLTHLNDELIDLESKLTNDAISGGKDVIKSTVTIVYGLATAAEISIPFLSIAMLLYTEGKTFYDIINTTDKINKIIVQIGDLQLKASQDAQALAGTKMVLQTLYNLELRFESLKDYLPGIKQMWIGELGKVKATIEAIQSGSDPQLNMELQSLPMANATWNEIQDFVQKTKEFQFTQGPPVVLNTTKIN